MKTTDRDVVVFDFETYYSDDFKLSKADTTQDYIFDPRFQVIGLSAVSKKAKVWVTGDEVAEFLTKQNERGLFTSDKHTCVFHNALFDTGILRLHYGIEVNNPQCTLSLLRTLCGKAFKLGLSEVRELLAKYIEIEDKGEYVKDALGMRLEDFSESDLEEYGAYCINDSVITYKLFGFLKRVLPAYEFDYQMEVLRAWTSPVLTTDKAGLIAEGERLQAARDDVFARVQQMTGAKDLDEVGKILRGRASFPNLLRDHYGIEVPMKPSKPSKNAKPDPDSEPKMTYQLAKGDEFMQMLVASEDEELRTLAEAKLNSSSTSSLNRIERLLRLTDGKPLAAPFVLSGAHTHRLGGTEKINLQNLPASRTDGGALRRCIQALGDDEVLVVADYKNVEVRTGRYIANDTDALKLLADGFDPYLIQASVMYGTNITELTNLYKGGDERAAMYRQNGKGAELGCGYGSGANGFYTFCRASKIPISEDDAPTIVNMYRHANPLVVNTWRSNEKMIEAMLYGHKGFSLHGPNGDLFTVGVRWYKGIKTPCLILPDGNVINYPRLHKRLETNPEKLAKGFKYVIEYMSGEGWQSLYGAKLYENQNQALAMTIAKHHIVELGRELKGCARFALNVHDELAYACKASDAEYVKATMNEVMSIAPPWMPGFPSAVSFDEITRYYK